MRHTLAHHPLARRQMLTLLGAGLAASALPVLPARAAAPQVPQAPAKTASPTAGKTPMEVWKDPNCGCCHDWIALMEQAGFAVTVHDSGNTAVRAKLGLPPELGSCHTALVGGYLVEGHVPAADVRKLLKERPQALGITVPGMPIGSPGMDGPAYGGRKDPYDVLLVSKTAGGKPSTRVFSAYR